MVAWICFVLMLSIILLQVFTRYVIKHPIPWTEELSRFAYIWAIFLGAVIAQKSRSHMVVSVVLEKMSPRVKSVFETFSDLVSIIILFLVLSGTIMMMRRTYGVLASTIPMSYSYVYLALAIGSFLMMALLLKDFMKIVVSFFSRRN